MNAYPNADNYLQPSFGTPQEAPSVDPDEGALILVAYNPEWTKTLLGAVTQMRQYAAWAGTHDEKNETVERVNSLMFQLQNDLSNVPAPFWDEDSGDDSDDTAPVSDQPWYGQLVIIDDRLTFVENAFIYVVAGFIAYAGLPTAAVSFVPIARNFVVTVKSNPLGGIVRFLADGVEIGRVDTYSAADGLISAPVAMPPPAMVFVAEDVTNPVFWVELLEDNPHDLPSVSMTLIRSRLSEADFSPVSVRYNPDTDQIEQTPDGGVTWNPAPGLDPRHSSSFLRPPVAGSSKQCDAAANMVKWLKDFIDSVLFDFELVGSVTTIVNTILLSLNVLSAGFASFLEVISELAETLSGIGAAGLILAFTPTEYDLLNCIFFCRADINGQVSADALVRIESDINLQLNTTAALVVNAILFLQGEIGLSNAGAIGSETGDCTDCACGWCLQQDFAVADGGYSLLDPSLGGHYTPGTGWTSTGGTGVANGIYINQHFTAARFTHVEFTYDSSQVGANVTLQGLLAGVSVFSSTTGSVEHGVKSWDGDETIDELNLQIGLGGGEGAQFTHTRNEGFDTPPDIPQDDC